MKKHYIIIFLALLFVGYVVYNEMTREKLVKHNTKEIVIDTKQLNNILDSVDKSQDSIEVTIDKLSCDNENHKIKNKKLKDSLNRLTKDRRNLEIKVQYLEQEKTREMVVQKITKDTVTSEK